MNEESKAIEKYLPLWGQTVCNIIDFFFTRREKHVVVVSEQFSTQFDKVLIETAEKAPMMARTFAKAAVLSMKEVEAVQAQHEAEKTAQTEQPN